ncbi:MAG: YkvA family protein [Pseudomonadota bacterium]
MSDAREMKAEAGDPDRAALPVAVERNWSHTRTRFLPKLLRVAGRIPFADDLAAAWYAAIDKDTPLKTKAVLLAALAYFVVPTDLMPDFVIGLGFTDDATVLATALGVVGTQIQERHRVAARKLLRRPEPKREDAETTPSA